MSTENAGLTVKMRRSSFRKAWRRPLTTAPWQAAAERCGPRSDEWTCACSPASTRQDRRAAYRLVDSRGQVPRSRQQLAPGIGESIHAEARKTNSHEAERGRRYQGGDAHRAERRL